MAECLGHSYKTIYRKGSGSYCAIVENKNIDRVPLFGCFMEAVGVTSPLRCPWNTKIQLTDKFVDPYREIFQWAILMNYQEISKHIWRYQVEAVPAAIMATKILKTLAEDVKDDREKVSQMKLDANEYEELAVGILEKWYTENFDKAVDLLVVKLPEWGGYTCLEVASEANDKNFISQPGVQYLLDKVWRNGLADTVSTLHLIFAGVFFPLIFSTIQFQEEDKNDKGEFKVHENEIEDQICHSCICTSGDDSGVSNSSNDSAQGTDSTGKIGVWCNKLLRFYNTPVVTFWMNVVSFVLYLVLFAFFLLSDFQLNTVSVSVFEYILVGWTSTLVLEEIRECVELNARNLGLKFLLYIGDAWNIMDFGSLIVFYVAFGLRWSQQLLIYALILYSIAFMIQCVRIVHIFAIHKILGPKIMMVGKMLKDLSFFLFILVVFLLAYGVASQALLYPNESNFGDIMAGVIYRPYWQIYGELFLDEINYDPNTSELACSDSNPDLPRCPQQNAWVPIISAVYLLFANVLLLNLLIAMFSYTFDNVQNQSNEIWKFQRYKLITDYYHRPPVVPPLIVLCYIYNMLRFVLQGIFPLKKDKEPIFDALRIDVGDKPHRPVEDLREWQRWHAEAFIREKHVEDDPKVDRQLEKMSYRRFKVRFSMRIASFGSYVDYRSYEDCELSELHGLRKLRGL